MIAEVIVDVAHGDVDRVFDYNISTSGATLGSRVEVPFGNRKIEGFVIKTKPGSSLAPGKIKDIVRTLDEFPAISDKKLKLAEFIRAKYHVPFALSLRQFIPAELRGGRVKKKLVTFVKLASEPSPTSMVAALRKGSTAQANIIGYLAAEKIARLSEVNEKFGAAAVKSLKDKGFIESYEEKAERIPYKELSALNKTVILTDEQKSAVEKISQDSRSVSLLFGVTGSGKT
ncbi:MAG: hypothetical protein J5836_00800, partial [Clostridia bacterium]|nr:hypothetical protein [Clostridia bacterium]